MVAGDVVLSAALVEQGGDPFSPHTTATRQGDGWRLDGTKSFVPAGMIAQAVVVSARTDDGIGLFVVDPSATGVSRRGQEATSRQIEAELELSGVVVGPGEVLVTGPAGVDALRWLLEHAEAALCLCVAGACDAAVKLTAQYTTSARAIRKAHRHLPGGGPACRRRLHRRRGRPAHGVAGGVAPGRGPARHQRGGCGQVLGRRGRASASCTPRSTSTVAWVSTATTRCTATTC